MGAAARVDMHIADDVHNYLILVSTHSDLPLQYLAETAVKVLGFNMTSTL